ncbi:MAG: DHA2 family efflux MFS transporter permease subunit [Chloroflexia bacterium]|nr:DHA2 family efflux MFS transporter permease subunit [Chloroflexia bacterium]
MVTTAKAPCDEAEIGAGSSAAAAPCSPATGRWVLAATILGSSIAFIDGTVVNVALPTIQEELGATQAAVQWVVQAYALFLAALILVGGSLGDHFGRRRIFALGVAIFAVASAGCGLAPTVEVLIAARALQGIGGALLVPGSLAIISAAFPTKEQRGRAIGTWSAFTAITSAVGPVVGGWLVDNASWRWVFYINLPLAAAVLAITLTRVPESRDPEAPPGLRGLDLLGAALVTVGLGALTFGLTEAPARGWGSPLVVAMLAVGVAALVGFVVAEARGAAPMMPLGLFRSRTFAGANLLTLLLYGALGGAFFFIPFNLIQVQGYTSTAAGATLLPMVVLLFALSRWAGGLVGRFGARPPLVVGPTVAALGFALLARPGIGGSYWTTVFPAVVVLGLGLAVTVAPLTTTVMGALADRYAGTASGINNAVSRVAGLLAIALFNVVLAAAFGAGLTAGVAELDVPPEVQQAVVAQEHRLAAAEPPAGVDEATAAAIATAIDEAFLGGYRLVMLMAAAMSLASAVIAWLVIEGSAVRSDAAEASTGV